MDKPIFLGLRVTCCLPCLSCFSSYENQLLKHLARDFVQYTNANNTTCESIPPLWPSLGHIAKVARIKQIICLFPIMIVRNPQEMYRNFIFIVCHNQCYRNFIFLVRMPCFRFVSCVINFKLLMLLLPLDIFKVKSTCRGWECTQKDSTRHGIFKGLVLFFFLSLFLFQKTWRFACLTLI